MFIFFNLLTLLLPLWPVEPMIRRVANKTKSVLKYGISLLIMNDDMLLMVEECVTRVWRRASAYLDSMRYIVYILRLLTM